MLYAITLTYSRPPEQIREHLDAHKDWLVKHIKSANVLFAGPLTDESGGFILAHAQQLADIQEMMAQDPFVAHRLVTLDIVESDPAIRSADFPAHWAVGAKSV
ncbi:hypothetical protein EXW72_05805 [Pseudomonas sp. BCA14]|uniref:YciI family protein n=1 Tax=unclassified Pseudomonas TaxID=196821 RepID=UPI00106E120D|nr:MULTISPECIES: YciI family protein [unclassified Pseudomonas]TFF14194.1 hypothetical protein EXW70_06685 [Pseudomonas sp. JMN1]TFF15122.1 hypothetical protein EXW71_02355 [Pseudomonas sp. BCA17]TFF31529.1 hypothetical protein EXW72_05805 [Pseudomonas sp. BCA14]TFF32482.1 hypothetical protein EXW73_01605 [Pseudomonas sp. BCA13]